MVVHLKTVLLLAVLALRVVNHTAGLSIARNPVTGDTWSMYPCVHTTDNKLCFMDFGQFDGAALRSAFPDPLTPRLQNLPIWICHPAVITRTCAGCCLRICLSVKSLAKAPPSTPAVQEVTS